MGWNGSELRIASREFADAAKDSEAARKSGASESSFDIAFVEYLPGRAAGARRHTFS
jgi:hypothetical protein